MADKKGNLRIIRLEVENVKRLRAVAISPKGDVVQITGANDNGKTSVLDSIWWAFAGEKAIQPKPMRDGEKKARIRVLLGGREVELIVERRFTPSGTTLVVESPDGARFGSPQRMLDAMVGALSFDPLAFTRMKAREQYDELRRISEVSVDIDELDAHSRGDFERRTEVNRQAKQKRAAAEAIAIPSAPDDGLSIEGALAAAQARVVAAQAQAIAKINDAGEHNAKVQTLITKRNDIERKAAASEDLSIERRARAIELRKEADELDRCAAANDAEVKEFRAALSSFKVPDAIDVRQVTDELQRLRDKADLYRQYADAISRRDVLAKEAEALEAEAESYTAKIAERDKQKAAAITSAKMPVEGLGFGEGLVTYKGVPFEQASSAVQLRVALSIAMASNPRLRVMRIQDGSLLDEKSMQLIADMAHERDYQVWVERVDTSGKIGVYIEDGSVKAVAP